MKRVRKIFVSLFVLLSAGFSLRAGLREDIEHLSHPLLEGRGIGTRGNVEASVFIMNRLRQSGLDCQIQFFPTSRGVGRNIYAVNRGNPRSGLYTLICAHYDGLGTINGTVYPGADSNASGVAVLLHLADSLSREGRNYIFAALDAYGEALAGAERFSGLPYKISMVVNLDTLGSTLAPPNKYRPDFLIVLGGKKYEKDLEKANEGPRLRLYYDYYRSKGFTDYFYTKISDQAPFLRKGAEAVMFTSGITYQTNKPEDTPATLDYPVLSRRACLILNWLSL